MRWSVRPVTFHAYVLMLRNATLGTQSCTALPCGEACAPCLCSPALLQTADSSVPLPEGLGARQSWRAGGDCQQRDGKTGSGAAIARRTQEVHVDRL